MRKIAIIGNMNNNGFSLMRYCRDLGYDADLLLYANDGIGSLSHFRPEDDTWNMEVWAPFIKQTKIINSLYAGLSGAMVLFVFAHALALTLKGVKGPKLAWISRRKLKKTLSEYDTFIVSGIAPAVLKKVGIRADIFFPYSTGVEHIDTLELRGRLKQMSWLGRMVTRKAILSQVEGVRKASNVFTAEFSATKDTLDRLNISFEPLAIPLVYLEKGPRGQVLSNEAASLVKLLEGKRYIFSAVRQMWKRPDWVSEEEWQQDAKNSDWLIRAYAEFVRRRADSTLVLVLVEYGPDVHFSKQLCHELDIANRVFWLPKLPRKEVMVVAQKAVAIAGAFFQREGALWGSVGWETLAAAKPLIHSFKFSPDQYETLYGTPCPPVLAVQNQDDILEYLLRLTDDPMFGGKVGEAAGAWFQKYQGRGLAGLWLRKIQSPQGASGRGWGLEP